MNEDQHLKKRALIENQLKILKSSFDNVQIFASSFDPSDGTTDYWTLGEGNVYAREGQVRDWVEGDKGLEHRDMSEGEED
jgi:hypothetical protein